MNVLVKNRFTQKVYFAYLDEKTLKVKVDDDWIVFKRDSLSVLFELIHHSNMFVQGNL